MDITLTLVMVTAPGRILLGYKKKGLGAGLWNGFGGKVHDGESVEAAAQRELFEETGLRAADLLRRGVLTIENREAAYLADGLSVEAADVSEAVIIHIFEVCDVSGELVETSEMWPRWFDVDRIPYGQMWPDDRQWLPLLLAGKSFRARAVFAGSDLLECLVQEVVAAT